MKIEKFMEEKEKAEHLTAAEQKAFHQCVYWHTFTMHFYFIMKVIFVGPERFWSRLLWIIRAMNIYRKFFHVSI